MSKLHTHYDNIQVTRKASDSVIRAAYKSLAQKYHPDKFDGSPAEAERIMKIVNEAYYVLSDPIRKAAYDESLKKDEDETRKAEELARRNSDAHRERQTAAAKQPNKQPSQNDIDQAKARFAYDTAAKNNTRNNVGEKRKKLPSVWKGAAWGAGIGVATFCLFWYISAGKQGAVVDFNLSTFAFFVAAGTLVGAWGLRHW